MKSKPTFLFAAAALVFAASCGEDTNRAKPIDIKNCGASCGGRMFILDDGQPAVPDAQGRVAGWNLDGLDSTKSDKDGCYEADFESPSGERGIDNQAGVMLNEIIKGTGEAFPQLLRNAIHDGGMLYIFEIIDGGTLQEGGENLAVVVRRGGGKPLLGTDKKLLPGQTYVLHEDPYLGSFQGGSLHNRRMRAGPFALRLPAVIFGVEYEINLVDAHADLEFSDDATMATGYVGGSFNISDVHKIADNIIIESLGDLVDLIIPPMADIRSSDSGECDRISVVLKVHAIRAFAFSQDTERQSDAVNIEPSFASIQTNVFNKNCVLAGCHDGSNTNSNLDLREGMSYGNLLDVISKKAPGIKRLVAGKPDESFLYIKLTQPGTGQGARMPQAAAALPRQNIEAIRDWIINGAKK